MHTADKNDVPPLVQPDLRLVTPFNNLYFPSVPCAAGLYCGQIWYNPNEETAMFKVKQVKT